MRICRRSLSIKYAGSHGPENLNRKFYILISSGQCYRAVAVAGMSIGSDCSVLSEAQDPRCGQFASRFHLLA